jgi:hypothetical protein
VSRGDFGVLFVPIIAKLEAQTEKEVRRDENFGIVLLRSERRRRGTYIFARIYPTISPLGLTAT